MNVNRSSLFIAKIDDEYRSLILLEKCQLTLQIKRSNINFRYSVFAISWCEYQCFYVLVGCVYVLAFTLSIYSINGNNIDWYTYHNNVLKIFYWSHWLRPISTQLRKYLLDIRCFISQCKKKTNKKWWN